MSFINEATPAAVQHRNWNWKLGQEPSGGGGGFPSGLFLSAVTGVNNGTKISADGVSWSLNAAPLSGTSLDFPAFGLNTGFMVLDATGFLSYFSTDDVTWSLPGTILPVLISGGSFAQGYSALAYSESLGRWVLSADPMCYSDDNGATWNASDSIGTVPSGVAWDDTLGLFVALNDSVSPPSGARYSATGLPGSWSACSIPANMNPASIYAVNGVFIMGCADQTPGAMGFTYLRSTDGQNFSLLYHQDVGGGLTAQRPGTIVSDPTGQNIIINESIVGSINYFYSTNAGSSWTPGSIGGFFAITGACWYGGVFYLSRRNGEIYTTATGAAPALQSTLAGAGTLWGLCVSP